MTALSVPGSADPVLDIAAALVQLQIADSVGLAERTGVTTMATLLSTDPRVERSDLLQNSLGEGPSITGGYLDDVLSSDDIEVDGRWPTWAPAARDLGIGALISVRLYTVSDTTGILTLYFHTPRTITDDDRQVAALAGIHASIELNRRYPLQQHHRLWRTVESQHRIGQAQGILMEKLQISAAAAFTVLHRLANDTGTKLDDLVDQLLETGSLPESPASR